MDELPIKPLRREARLVVASPRNSDEVLIYDRESDRAHLLNPVLAAFWKACDGTRTLPEIASDLPDAVKAPDALQAFQSQVALSHLHREGLLAAPTELPESFRVNRRKVVGLAATLVPAITSILTPTAAEAASLLPKDAPCIEGPQCVSGMCVGGKCWSLT